MTFTEAAQEILRQAGKPLHFKDITQMAIDQNLLSHVGKTPDVTMGNRLSAQVKKDPDGAIVKTKPGVFGLKEWESGGAKKKGKKAAAAAEEAAPEPAAEEAAPEAEGDDDDAGVDPVAALAEQMYEAEAPVEKSAEKSAAREEKHDARNDPRDEPPISEEEERPLDEDEKMRSELAAGATDLFEEEDDDDQPLFGGPEPAQGGAAQTGEPGRRRRRRRRRGKGRDEGQGAGPGGGGGSFAQTARIPGMEDDEEETIGVTIGDERDEQPTRRAIVLERVPPPQQHGGRGGRQQDYRAPLFQRAAHDQGGGGRGGNVDLSNAPAFDTTEPLDDLSGRDLADVVHAIVSSADRMQGPVPFRNIADAALRRGKLTGDPALATSAIAAAARADNIKRTQRGERVRFRFANGGRVAPTDWSLGPDLLRLEQDLLVALDRYRDGARRSLASRLQKDMSGPALVELLLVALERIGFRDVKPVRRAGLPGGESHFSGVHVTAGDEIRTAIVLRRDGREIGRERVIDLRGSLHHYGPATAGWLITTGQVLSGAREEAAAPGTSPVALFDSLAFAKLLEENGVAVTSTRVEIPLPDVDLLETLRGV